MSEELQFNPELVTSVEKERQLLAQYIAGFFNSDDSMPDMSKGDEAGWNLWVSDKKLRDLEAHIRRLGRERKEVWGYFADVCENAMNQVSDESGRLLLFVSGVINGTRRTTRPDWGVVKEMMASADQRINALEDTQRRQRIQSLYGHNMTVIARFIGNYALAVVQSEHDAKTAFGKGDVLGGQIALLMARVDQLNMAIHANRDAKSDLLSLKYEAAKLTSILAKDDVQQLFNAWAHIIEAHGWTDLRMDPLDANFLLSRLDELKEINQAFYSAREGWITALRAVVAYQLNERKKALRLANDVLTTFASQGPADAIATASLVMARVIADPYLMKIVNEGEHLHQLIAAAQRILNQEDPPAYERKHQVIDMRDRRVS